MNRATSAVIFFSSVYRAVRTSSVRVSEREAATVVGASFILWSLVSSEFSRRGYAIRRIPRLRGAQRFVHILNVFHALVRQPVLKSVQPLLRVHWNAVFPCCTSAEHARKIHSGLGGERQRFDERLVADPCRQIYEWLLGSSRGALEILNRLFFRIHGFALQGLCTADEVHVHRHFDFQDVDQVLRLGKLLHGPDHHVRLLSRKLDSLVVRSFLIADEFGEKGNVFSGA